MVRPVLQTVLLRRVRDFADVRNDGIISASIAKQALSMLDVLMMQALDHLDS